MPAMMLFRGDETELKGLRRRLSLCPSAWRLGLRRSIKRPSPHDAVGSVLSPPRAPP